MKGLSGRVEFEGGHAIWGWDYAPYSVEGRMAAELYRDNADGKGRKRRQARKEIPLRRGHK